MFKQLCGLVLLAIAVPVAGCTNAEGGADQVPTHPVTGKVTMGGAPVPGATVTFSPVSQGKPAALGRTDAQGIYTLTTYDSGDGAAEGEYKVLISKAAPSAAASSQPGHDPTGASAGSAAPQHNAKPGAAAAGGGSLLPEKFSSVATTPLTKTVTSGENTIDLQLE